jgi:phosphomethylpyrimidine synthase
VRDYAHQQGLSEQAALEQGMAEKSQEFKAKGSEIYLS